MATETELLREVINANGGACDDLPDNLKSTLYKKLINVCSAGGGGTSGSGGTCSWNDLADKPFGVEMSEGIPEFDGDLTGKEVVTLPEGGMLVKISDREFTKEELIGSTIIMTADSDVIFNHVGRIEDVIDNVNEDTPGMIIGVALSMGVVYVIGDIPQDIAEMIPLSRGTWYVYAPGYYYVNYVSCVHDPVETIKKIDPKYLPEDSCILTSSNGTKFKVTVSDDGTLTTTEL